MEVIRSDVVPGYVSVSGVPLPILPSLFLLAMGLRLLLEPLKALCAAPSLV